MHWGHERAASTLPQESERLLDQLGKGQEKGAWLQGQSCEVDHSGCGVLAQGTRKIQAWYKRVWSYWHKVFLAEPHMAMEVLGRGARLCQSQAAPIPGGGDQREPGRDRGLCEFPGLLGKRSQSPGSV